MNKEQESHQQGQCTAAQPGSRAWLQHSCCWGCATLVSLRIGVKPEQGILFEIPHVNGERVGGSVCCTKIYITHSNAAVRLQAAYVAGAKYSQDIWQPQLQAVLSAKGLCCPPVLRDLLMKLRNSHRPSVMWHHLLSSERYQLSQIQPQRLLLKGCNFLPSKLSLSRSSLNQFWLLPEHHHSSTLPLSA